MEAVHHQVIKKVVEQFSKYTNLINNQNQASKYLFEVAKSQKKYLLINIISGLLNAFLEGLALTLIYLIVRIFSQSKKFKNWDSNKWNYI